MYKLIKAILVDDERPALKGLEFQLKKHPEIAVVGMYTNPLEAISDIESIKPQVVFLDINMPSLRGTDAASKILDQSPETDIVFVTAFDQYAIEAFELHAIDYILKPVDEKRLAKTIERLMKKPPIADSNNKGRLLIKCLGGLVVTWENKKPIKWRTEKTKEIFAFLLHNHGKTISKDKLLDNLWPDDLSERATRQLYNGIYYIRKALEEYGIDRRLVHIDGDYNLRLDSEVGLDVRQLYCNKPHIENDSLDFLEKLEELYTGDYFEGEYYPWADYEREKLIKIYNQYLIRLADKYYSMGYMDKSERALMKAYSKNPYDESITEGLLRLYINTGEKSKAARHFSLFYKLLSEELGIKPNNKIQEIYRTIIAD